MWEKDFHEDNPFEYDRLPEMEYFAPENLRENTKRFSNRYVKKRREPSKEKKRIVKKTTGNRTEILKTVLIYGSISLLLAFVISGLQTWNGPMISTPIGIIVLNAILFFKTKGIQKSENTSPIIKPIEILFKIIIGVQLVYMILLISKII